ncbi:HPr family phosphocarrier protein [Maricaulaceae bacterium MS644]
MTCSKTVTICNQRGLHARASAKFVAEAGKFDARITLSRDGEQVQADSIMELLMLAAGPGAQVTIHAEGADAQDALDALSKLVEAGFDEVD